MTVTPQEIEFYSGVALFSTIAALWFVFKIRDQANAKQELSKYLAHSRGRKVVE
jgi:hypothetical protein